ncbi:hypothetical protein DT594_02910 [Halopseudomonas laoshanensis]|uniref:Uncharacterized protein n=1 Tax=Halopseudomonas laoshanensis TaxID=2268758 RepID=A0A7V7GVT4_9GAMM|nr:hypothetical protein [Halopseudomonas laoshanensis]KAA0696324.1 hypothetical protein DT594_02910 [Halopseudomonas laoshanensis]
MSDRKKKLEELLLRADWDDAPLRARQKRGSHKGMWLSFLAVCIAFVAVANYLDSKQLSRQNIHTLASESRVVTRVTATAQDEAKPAAISQASKQKVDSYDEQVKRLLAEPTEGPSTTQPKQTVFNDVNYIPVKQVNTVSMGVARPPAASQLSPVSRHGYVTVVQETKPSCWPYKPGSISCRNFKKAMKSGHNQLCYNSAHSYTEACRRAALYNPVQ